MANIFRIVLTFFSFIMIMAGVSCAADNTTAVKQEYAQVIFQDADTEETLMSMNVVKGDVASVITEDSLETALDQLGFPIDDYTKAKIVMQLTDMIGVPIEDDVYLTIEGLNPNSDIK